MKSTAVHWSRLQCSEVYCSTIQLPAVQWSLLQCNEGYCSAVKGTAVQYSFLQCSEVHCGAVKCSAVQWRLLQYITVHCSVLHSPAGPKARMRLVWATWEPWDWALYTVSCTLYSIQCTMFSVQCTVYTVHCTLYIVNWTIYSVYCILCTGHSLQSPVQMPAHFVPTPPDRAPHSRSILSQGTAVFTGLKWFAKTKPIGFTVVTFCISIIILTDRFVKPSSSHCIPPLCLHALDR